MAEDARVALYSCMRRHVRGPRCSIGGMTMPEFNLLEFNLPVTLDVLLAEGSAARASRRLGLSASAMSRALARRRSRPIDEETGYGDAVRRETVPAAPSTVTDSPSFRSRVASRTPKTAGTPISRATTAA